jgi:hypothetical protein
MEFFGGHIAMQIANRQNAVLNEKASSNEVQVAQLTRDNLLLRSNVATLENTMYELKTAIPPRVISPQQRDSFIEALINLHPKIPIKVIVGDTNKETDDFARELRKLLNEAGYGTNNEEIIRLQGLKFVQATGGGQRTPWVFALFSSNTRVIPMPNFKGFVIKDPSNNIVERAETPSFAQGFGSVSIMNPTADSIAHGDKTHPTISRPTNDPNDILYGISEVLNFNGIITEQVSGSKILKSGEIGFFIPSTVD